jgi:hypothetical protein
VTGTVLAVLIALSATVVAAVQRSACRPDPDQRPGRAHRHQIAALEQQLKETP